VQLQDEGEDRDRFVGWRRDVWGGPRGRMRG